MIKSHSFWESVTTQHFDKKKVIAELNLDEETFNELLQDFIKQSEKAIGDLDTAIGADAFDEVAKIGHFIKGSSGNLRITRMHTLAGKIEMIAKDNQNKGEIEENSERLKKELKRLHTYI